MKNSSIQLCLPLLLLSTICVASFAAAPATAQQNPNRQLVQTDAPPVSSPRRIALVIGNGAYASAPSLKNPPNDARDMAATLSALGFDVSRGVNVGQREMKRLIREFGQKLKSGGHGLFYYAGHGVQARGRNFIIPVDAVIESEADVEDSGVDVGLVLNYMDDAQNGLNIVILDACRNNPFARSFRSASDGLAQVDAPTGTLIAYATAPGKVAADGVAENGLYTSELLKAMKVAGLSVTDMLMQVRAEVMKRTGGRQVPWEASSLVGGFYFNPAIKADPLTTKDRSGIDTSAFELSYWDSIKTSSNVEDFNAYLTKYPNGQFADLARNRVAQFAEAAKNPPTGPVSKPAGSWALPEVEGDPNCLDEMCKTLRRIVSAALGDFKSIAGGPISNDEGQYSNATIPGYFFPRCRVYDHRPGLASSFYFCSYNGQFVSKGSSTAYRAAYDKTLSAFGRALPGWHFKSKDVWIRDQTWTIAAAGPSECSVETCPVKIRLLDKDWPYGQLTFEVESAHNATEQFPTEAFKKQFTEDIRSLLTAAPNKFRDLAPGQSFAKYGFCNDVRFDNNTAERRCQIGPIPMGRIELVYELAKRTVREQYPTWIFEGGDKFFKAKPTPTAREISILHFNEGEGFRLWFWVPF